MHCMVHTLWIVMVLQIKTKLLTHFDVAYVRSGFFRYYSLCVVPVYLRELVSLMQPLLRLTQTNSGWLFLDE